ncbi:PREDICTED: squamosa promoter-binding-like protein 1 [Nelumbo nucifera]|nr:PREDICTED: squamosa promoter-binding-like protein 1 [Nelumbo nucifera]
METKIGGDFHHFYGPSASDFMLKEKDLLGVGKKSLEWDLNDWRWDGDLFIANPLNSVPSDCRSRQLFPGSSGIPTAGGSSNSSSSCSDEINPGSDKGNRELEKKRRVIVVENEDLNDEVGSLTLKLGGHGYPVVEGDISNWDGKNGKKTKLLGTTSNRAVCQVVGCGADLSNAKDYHRRHKVCDMHSKASKALVSNVMQRFCQQCSRFHVLQEFDEGKRSCRRRLAGHNRRRRKTHPDAAANGSSLSDDRASSYLLISLLRILSNMHSNSSDQTKDQDLLSHLFRSLANIAGTLDGRNISGLLRESQDLLNVATSVGTSSEKVSPPLVNGIESTVPVGSTSKINRNGAEGPEVRPLDQFFSASAADLPQKGMTTADVRVGTLQAGSLPKSTTVIPIKDSHLAKAEVTQSTVGRIKLNNIDLNNIYNDSQDCIEDMEGSQAPVVDFPSWMQQDSHQSSPPQASGNSDSVSAQSPSSSSGDTQSRTDRIVFKLFGKDPNDFPLVLRAQILDWLSHSPTDMESYIRPGCIILTVYLRLPNSTWEDICCDLSLCLRRLLDASDDTFWTTGWVYTRVQHQIAFVYNGQIVLNTSLPLKNHSHCRISSIAPIAVSSFEKAEFIVKGLNLSWPTTRLLCAVDGKYLVQEATHDLVEATETSKEYDEIQCLRFHCSLPDVIGRGFIEVEDHGLSSSFFPFIVAEQDVCSEIRMLEGVIEAAECENGVQGGGGKIEAKNQALDFIHEMGWLLHRTHVRSRLGHMDPNLDAFSFRRFRWIMEFSIDHGWCAVVKKLLDIVFKGNVDVDEHPSVEFALSEMGILHRAVRRNCRPLVELLLRYKPEKVSDEAGSEHNQQGGRANDGFLFRPDAIGPAGLTPLHAAASRDGNENVLDALTDDPGMVGVEAWKSARDSTGFTPEDYARLRGHYSYIHLVYKKVKKPEAGHVVLDIPGIISECTNNQKQIDGLELAKETRFHIDKTKLGMIRRHCKICDQQLTYSSTSRSLVYKPAMLSMVAIAAVCVCVALLFKSSPEVLCVFPPFRWELLDYGPM